jgi:hypothetical protein
VPAVDTGLAGQHTAVAQHRHSAAEGSMRDVVITGGTSPCRTGRHRDQGGAGRAALFTANPDDVIIGQAKP